MDLNELQNLTEDNASAVDFLREKECIWQTPPSCHLCQKNMSLFKITTYRYIWRCSAHKGKRETIKKGSFFKKSHIPLTKVSDCNSFLCNSLAKFFITAYLNSTQQNVKTLFMWLCRWSTWSTCGLLILQLKEHPKWQISQKESPFSGMSTSGMCAHTGCWTTMGRLGDQVSRAMIHGHKYHQLKRYTL